MNQSENMPKQQLKWIVTANFTADGSVAYLGDGDKFSRQVADVVVFETKDDAEVARLRAVQRESVVSEPYLTEVAGSPGALDVLSAKERIRSQGPTVPYGRPSKSAV